MNILEVKIHKFKSVLLDRETYVSIITALYILLFLYAATSKLIDYQKFEVQLAKSPILTDFAFILVWLVPSVEIIIAVLIIIPRTIMLGLYGALALMSMFTAYIISILNFSDTIPCSCGGILQRMGWSEHLVFNVIFVILAIMGILLQAKIIENKSK